MYGPTKSITTHQYLQLLSTCRNITHYSMHLTTLHNFKLFL
jgi:hypothetical protein